MFTLIFATIVGAITIVFGLGILIAVGIFGLYAADSFDRLTSRKKVEPIKEYYIDRLTSPDILELVLVGFVTFLVMIVFMFVGCLVLYPFIS